VANSLKRTHGRTPQSIVQEDDHSDVGVTFSGGNRYTGIYSIHSVYTPNEQLNMTFPAGQSGQELLYSPTTKMPDGGCLENGTYYLSVDPAQTFAGFYIFDFCGTGGFAYFHDIDAAFHRAYVRNLNDVPSYVVQELADRRVLTANTVWTTYLYNFASSRWDAVFREAGRTGGLAGWSIFESYYLPGQCPSLPTMQARQIQLYDPQRGWIHVTASMPDTSVDTGGGGTLDCFNLAPVSYKFTFVKSNWWWRVSSTGN
jgi:hypothetical protein